MNAARIIFLDFDGVINTDKQRRRFGIDAIGRGQVAVLNKVIEATDAEIVVSSTWREFHTIAELDAFLSGAKCCRKISGVTPVHKGFSRSYEIRKWIDNATVNGYKISNIAIVDDYPDAGVNFEKHFVQTNDFEGMNAIVGNRMIHILRNVPYDGAVINPTTQERTI